MASLRQLKQRIRSVKNTKQITKAMQLVAASKMRRAQDIDKASTPYSHAASELLTYLASQGVTRDHPLFVQRKVNTRLLIVISADKGLVGAYNANVLKAYLRELSADKKAGVSNQTITVGRKSSQFAARLKDVRVVGVYEQLPDRPEGSELRAILDTAREQFISGDVDAVDIIFTEFRSSIDQQVKVQRILPAGFTETEVSQEVREALYEPDVETVLNETVYRLIEAQIFQALLDGKASEYSMQMIAMKNATDNASELADDLTMAMNKVRQGAITQELAEISGGVEALSE
ncbi:MAG TPA: ATP synthase F1 subunit gamma [Candidatus Saccharimonadales bacterium]|nr:ATP synthase F1 subunit gamma [Candidatus Saccharimonadales bacterium]